MQAIEDLKDEHRVIEVVLSGLERWAGQLDRGKPLDGERVDRVLEILRNFADKCHHGKEERYLFKTLETRGVPRDRGLVLELLKEHGEGRRLLREMARAAAEPATEAGAAFAERALAYVSLLRAHIRKEEDVLFPLSEQKLTPEDDAALMEGFRRIESEEMGEGAHERYHQWAHELVDAE